jgi:hypothetical protein
MQENCSQKTGVGHSNPSDDVWSNGEACATRGSDLANTSVARWTRASVRVGCTGRKKQMRPADLQHRTVGGDSPVASSGRRSRAATCGLPSAVLWSPRTRSFIMTGFQGHLLGLDPCTVEPPKPSDWPANRTLERRGPRQREWFSPIGDGIDGCCRRSIGPSIWVELIGDCSMRCDP